MADPTREELIELCEEAASVPVSKWSDRDAPSATLQLGQAWALLKSGCSFRVSRSGSLTSSDSTWWVYIQAPTFMTFEYGSDEVPPSESHFYIPTAKRLDDTMNSHWYC